MKIAVGSDHAGFALKQEVLRFLKERGFEFHDFGVYSEERADYPDVGVEVAQAVAAGDYSKGILICATGIGMSITANKVPGIRAALCTDTFCAQMSREHNDANILVLGAKVVDKDTALKIVDTWLATEFPGEERHARRIDKIRQIENHFNRGGSRV
jgi:ribose 5-phosphate isomerase B